MRIRLLRPPPITVRLDRDYRVEPLWEEVSESGYLAAYFRGHDHWKLTDFYRARAPPRRRRRNSRADVSAVPKFW